MNKKIIFLILLILIFIIIKKYNLLYDNLSYSKKINLYKKKLEKTKNYIIKTNEKISKNDGHVFGLPKKKSRKIDLSKYNNILNIDYNNNIIEVEGNITMAKMLDKLLKNNYMMNVPIDLYHLTISGLICGVGGGSTSFKYGFIHENIYEFDIILANGEVKTCSKSKNQDLFNIIPNSLGTLGYLTRIKLKIEKIEPYVKLYFKRYYNSEDYFRDLEVYTKKGNKERVEYTFLEGTILGPNNLVLLIGIMEKNLPKNEKIYNKTDIFWELIQDNNIQYKYFSIYDYLWRWDRDLYYTTMETPKVLNNKILRKFVPKCLMKSTIYRSIAKLIRMDHKALDCNDIFIPFENCNKFFDWFKKEYDLYPIYICPSISKSNNILWSKASFVDFGIGYGVNIKNRPRPKKLLERLERKMLELNGRKLLYTEIQVDEDTMWKFFKGNKEKYYEMKNKYDPKNKFMTIYEKSRKKKI